MTRRKTAPPRGVLKNAADPGRARLTRYYPSPDLEMYVEHYWLVEWDLRGQPSERVETLPHPSIHLIFERNVGGRIGGIAPGKFSRLLEGEGGVFAVKFTPGGFYPFVKIPISTFADSIVPIEQVFDNAGERLEQAILEVQEDASRITIVENFLRARRPEPDDNVSRIGKMVYAVAEDRSILQVEDLVTRYGIAKRTLQRLFARYVGTTPKWVIQRYRLHEAAEQLAAGPVNQSALALSVGYSDQAHFVRDFKAIVGISPAAYAREARAASGLGTGPEKTTSQ
ncbi:MAG: helix-turn-helix transcriptional regulator [Gemmatimonadota bacterium]